ncbi:MAG: diacylglycerol kinase family protein [Pseudomonadota bacterium]|uniref:diacylglycerol/lipid kinase family protein n=1 Tax=Sphingomonas sp. ERG5 TaxID=1381597 RepID=UPI00068E00CB|nr:diacylglycerol kinase family protein [Sphingomonas sp. ERG5]
MSRRLPVLINKAGGTAAGKGPALADEVRAAFAEAGIEIDLVLLDAGDLRDAVMRLTGVPVIVIGGGDGTLGCAARVLVERGEDVALGILPLGTRNHLARELGIPLDLAGAAAVIASHARRQIDVAWAGDAMFLNNASIGLYPEMVRVRDDTQRRHKVAKWLAAIAASAATLRRVRHHRLRLRSAGQDREIVTPMLFVGNNHYEIEQGHPGKRTALDDGLLSVFAIGPSHRFQLIGLALRSLLGLTRRDRDFAAIGDVAELDVTGQSSTVDIALDGEVMKLSLPLAFRIDPLALTVVALPLAAS